MTPDTCPHCGAARIPLPASFIRFSCGTRWGGWQPEPTQSPECARYVRVRISQLKRLARCADKRMDELIDLDADDNGFSQGFYWRWFGRFTAFRDACLREIDRLRGGA